MRVIVATTQRACPAASALHMEGLPHEVCVLDDELAYSRLLARLWADGEAFLTLEHDIVPWPGAVADLAVCDRLWCQHWSFVGPGKLRQGLGSLRLTAQALALAPTVPERWRDVDWRRLDGHVIPALQAAFGAPHVHTPPFAHVKGYV